MALYILKTSSNNHEDSTCIDSVIELIGPFKSRGQAYLWSRSPRAFKDAAMLWGTLSISDDSVAWMKDENDSAPNAYIVNVSSPQPKE